MSDDSAHRYLLRAQCPWCGSTVELVERRDHPVPLMQDVEPIDTFYCPHCSEAVHRSDWDIHEEAYIERAQDPTEASNDGH